MDRNEKYNAFVEVYESLNDRIPLIKEKGKSFCIITQCSKGKYNEALPAKDIYKSLQVKYLKEITELHPEFDMWILSAGYGWVHQNKIVSPYEQSFNSLSRKEVTKFSKDKELREQFDELAEQYDIIFVALGDKYMHTLDLSKPFECKARIIFILPEGRKGTHGEPSGKSVENYYTNINHTTLHGASVINLKGRILQGFIKGWVKRFSIDNLYRFNQENLDHYINSKTFLI